MGVLYSNSTIEVGVRDIGIKISGLEDGNAMIELYVAGVWNREGEASHGRA
jgi:hypothetical protein